MKSSSMLIKDLLAGFAAPGTFGAIAVNGLQLDSRQVGVGDAFVALRGATHHGIAFAPAALARGASVILSESPAPAAPIEGPLIWIDGLREQVGRIAARFYAEPSHSLDVIGVTGTNGKTSTVQLIVQALSVLGRGAASIGTLGAGLHGALQAGERTTPDAIQVQALLGSFRDAGAAYVAMEVSSHALEQGRVNGVDFDIAVFTNLTRDHLDYHGNMQAYGAAKARLFGWTGLSCAVINIDDEFGRRLLSELPAGIKSISYAIEQRDAAVHASQIVSSAAGLSFELSTPWGAGRATTRLLGRFNVANLLAVVACLGELGFTFSQIQNAISQLEPVAGRMNRLGGSDDLPLVVIDYAHTPDALEQALSSLRAHGSARLICVFGCGGDRDAGKRPQMGAIAERLADLAIVTDDNPRSEDGDAIVQQILAGLRKPQAVIVERQRSVAISRAVCEARAGDIVLIAGKGHEDYQEIAGRKLPFDDLRVAAQALEARPC
jgi:UDP-N-acetylmuramoyl-L-alanyl-D-glutamate--2,6-diaminopimelate ligase